MTKKLISSLFLLTTFSLMTWACSMSTENVAPVDTISLSPSTAPTDAPEPTPIPTATASPTSTPDPFEGVIYETTIELGQELCLGCVAAVDQDGNLVQLNNAKGEKVEPNGAGFYQIDKDGKTNLYSWNSQEGKLVEAYTINGGNLRKWDPDKGDYKGVRDEENEQIKANELVPSEEGLGLAAVDKDGGLILWIDVDDNMQYPSEAGLLSLGGHYYYWRTETQALREIISSTADADQVASELGLTHEDYLQFVITIGRNNNDGEWYNYVALAGEDREDVGARLARLNPDGTWTKLTYETQAGKEEMFGHLVPMDENAIMGYSKGDFFHPQEELGLESINLQGYATGLRGSYNLDNLDRYTSETVEVFGPIVAMRGKNKQVLLGLGAWTSPQFREFYKNDFLRISDDLNSGMNFEAGETEVLWRLITPGRKIFTRMFKALPDRLSYYDKIVTIDGKEVGLQYAWMMYQTYRQYLEQVAVLVSLLEGGELGPENTPIFIIPSDAGLVIAPDY